MSLAARHLDPADGLKVVNLDVSYRMAGSFLRPARLQAVRDVSFDLLPGRTLGIVGESGCGKSSVARAIAGLARAEGRIEWRGRDLAGMAPAARRHAAPGIQMVFQDPVASLDPRMRVASLIGEPLLALAPIPRRDRRHATVHRAAASVGLSPDLLDRLPHELSGGQAQRVGIARALVTDPGLLICDEAVSALDVSVQAQILDLLAKVQAERGIAILFIGHDLAVMRLIADEILVLYLGRVMEVGPVDAIFEAARHPYTRLLIASALGIDPRIERGRSASETGMGEVPSPLDPPSGCVFRTRCRFATEVCRRDVPMLRAMPEGQRTACHHSDGQLP